MDPDRLRFLFGTIPDEGAWAGEDGRIALLRADRSDEDLPLRTVVANQVLDGSPAQTWTTAAALGALALDRHAVMDVLVDVLAPFVASALRDKEPFDDVGYTAVLAGLARTPTDAEVEAYLAVAAEQVALPLQRLRELAAARLGLDRAADPLLDRIEELVIGPDAPITTAAPDLLVYVPALVAGVVLTHRLSAAEHVESHLELDADLAGFLRVPEPLVGGVALDQHDGAWCGPENWLDGLPLDALLAVRVGVDGAVTLTPLDADPVAPEGLIEAVRAVYDTEQAALGLPVTAEILLVGLLVRDRAAFAEPRPPLTELAAAAGLEQRGPLFAHDESVWAAGAVAARRVRMVDRLGDGAASDVAIEVLEMLVVPVTEPALLRRLLGLLDDPDILVAVVDGLLEEPDAVPSLVSVAERLVAAAGRSPRAAVAGWIAAVAAERDGRIADAESHLRAAAQVTDAWWLVADRLALYESDRGDAAAALGRWLDAGAEADDPDVVAVRPFAVAAGPEPGRNDPCWCGSGRKYKQCHLGRPATAPLPERAGWLYRKAVGYLERRSGAAADLLELHAEALAGVDADPDEVFEDPLVADTVLHEGGWFAQFLADRGPLLPPDERELAASWLDVPRDVYEVVDAGSVRDVRFGELIEVVALAGEPGEWLCARALPDGGGRRLLVAPVEVSPDEEDDLFAVLDSRDAVDLLDLLGAQPADEPPRTVLREPPAAAAVRTDPPPVVLQLRERRENRWCDDPAPALDGLTPRVAAADPARRPALDALLAALPGDDPVSGRLGLRPERLRDLLGL